jgi:aspartate racemase
VAGNPAHDARESGFQQATPGIVGISTYVDHLYQLEMQQTAAATMGSSGPINRLRSITVTLDFAALVARLAAGDVSAAEQQVTEAARAIHAGGADFLVVTSGTTSTLAAPAQAELGLPILELADAACSAFASLGGTVAGLLSTRRAASAGRFPSAAEVHGVQLVPLSPRAAEAVDSAIFSDLVYGRMPAGCADVLRDAMAELASEGADAIIVGNTDMSLWIDSLQDGSPVTLVDAARAHARAAATAALTGRIEA